MNASAKGRRAEWKARALLEAAGFTVCRAAGSKGPADLVAWDATSIKFVSVKSGSRYATAIEREVLATLPRPANATVEIWRYPDRAPGPIVERL